MLRHFDTTLMLFIWKRRSAGVKINSKSKTSSFSGVLQIMLALPLKAVRSVAELTVHAALSQIRLVMRWSPPFSRPDSFSFCIHDCCPVKNKLVCFCTSGDSFTLWGAFTASQFIYVAQGLSSFSRAGCGKKSSLRVEAHCSNPLCAEYYMKTWQQLHIQRSWTPAQSHRLLQQLVRPLFV